MPPVAAVGLGLVGVAVIAPFLYMVSVSLMGESELLRWPPPLLPQAPTFGNYAAALAGTKLSGNLNGSGFSNLALTMNKQ